MDVHDYILLFIIKLYFSINICRILLRDGQIFLTSMATMLSLLCCFVCFHIVFIFSCLIPYYIHIVVHYVMTPLYSAG